MRPKHCPNCEVQQEENSKFCSKCGAAFNGLEKANNPDDGLSSRIDKKPNSKLSKILFLVFIVGMVMFYIIKSVTPEFDDFQKVYSISEELIKIEGTWQDPTGALLGDPNSLIILSKKGDVVVGKDKDEKIKIQLSPSGSSNYSAKVILHGVEGDFEAHYYKDENKLVFFSTLTKTSWNIKKLKD